MGFADELSKYTHCLRKLDAGAVNLEQISREFTEVSRNRGWLGHPIVDHYLADINVFMQNSAGGFDPDQNDEEYIKCITRIWVKLRSILGSRCVSEFVKSEIIEYPHYRIIIDGVERLARISIREKMIVIATPKKGEVVYREVPWKSVDKASKVTARVEFQGEWRSLFAEDKCCMYLKLRESEEMIQLERANMGDISYRESEIYLNP